VLAEEGENSMTRTGFVLLLCSFGCATIMHGSSQDVSINSTPSGAEVISDNVPSGKTPVLLHLKRGDAHTIKVNVPGYLPYEIILTKSVSGWVWGNLLFGGLIGLAVDAITGGLYYLNPEQVQAQLAQEPQSAPKVATNDDRVHIYVVLSPDPSWKLVAQLDRFPR
jgi:hypothetical protein